MTNRTAGHRYARALFDVALKESQDLEAVGRQLTSFAELFAQYPALGKLLMNPAVPTSRKRAAIVELTARAAVAPVVAKLLLMLADRDRLVILPDVIAAYQERVLAHRHVVRAEVTTAAPLAADRVHAIETSLARATGRTVTLSTRVDAAILGGVVARIGSTLYDASIAGHLQKLKQQLSESV